MPVPVVVVTGASGGIGVACVDHLARRGFEVLAAARRSPAGAQIARRTDRVWDLTLDVADPGSCRRAATLVGDLVGPRGLAGLVNNAGICTLGPLELVDDALLRRQFDVNVFGTAAITRACLPLLCRARGRIVNMGSIAGRSTLPATGAYSASKHALVSLTEALRMEVRPFGMHAAIVEPGAIETPLWDKLNTGPAHMSEHHSRYARLVERLDVAMAGSRRAAIGPEAVARAVHHALTARRPRTRYLVGRDARVRAVLQWLPDTMRERLYAWALGFPFRPEVP